MIFLTGIVAWVNWPAVDGGLAYERLRPLLHPIVTKLALFVVIFFTLFHCAHRLKFTIPGLLGIHDAKDAFGGAFYLLALQGTFFAGWVLWRI